MNSDILQQLEVQQAKEGLTDNIRALKKLATRSKSRTWLVYVNIIVVEQNKFYYIADEMMNKSMSKRETIL